MQRALHTSCVLCVIVTAATVKDGSAQTTRPVDCSVGETITAAVATAKPGDTLAVRGACKETVIREDGSLWRPWMDVTLTKQR